MKSKPPPSKNTTHNPITHPYPEKKPQADDEQLDEN